jgi:serine protease Do
MKSMNYLASQIKHWMLALSLLLPAGWVTPLLHAQTTQGSRIVMAPQSDVAYLGITMEDVTSANMATYKLNVERGVIVRSVEPGSPAAAAKLQEKDVILEFGGFPAWSAEQFQSLVRQTPPGRKVDLAISREGKRMNFSVELGKRSGSLNLDSGGGPAAPSSNREEYSFIGPDGRAFRFNMPGGRTFGLQVPETPQPQRQKLGVTLQPLTDQLAEHLGIPGGKGVLVVSAEAGSPAAGKIEAGDVIIKADDQIISQAEDLVRIVQPKVGMLQLQLIRNGKEISVTVDLPLDATTPSRGYTM